MTFDISEEDLGRGVFYFLYKAPVRAHSPVLSPIQSELYHPFMAIERRPACDAIHFPNRPLHLTVNVGVNPSVSFAGGALVVSKPIARRLQEVCAVEMLALETHAAFEYPIVLDDLSQGEEVPGASTLSTGAIVDQLAMTHHCDPPDEQMFEVRAPLMERLLDVETEAKMRFVYPLGGCGTDIHVNKSMIDEHGVVRSMGILCSQRVFEVLREHVMNRFFVVGQYAY